VSSHEWAHEGGGAGLKSHGHQTTPGPHIKGASPKGALAACIDMPSLPTYLTIRGQRRRKKKNIDISGPKEPGDDYKQMTRREQTWPTWTRRAKNNKEVFEIIHGFFSFFFSSFSFGGKENVSWSPDT
jgi:hypothetical protein